MKKNKEQGFKLLFHYLKNDKFKIFLYVLFAFMTYFPDIIAAIFWGKALEALILKNFSVFALYLFGQVLIYAFCYGLLQIPKNYLYNYLELKFVRNVTKDIYEKYQDLPAIAYEEMGVGELINRLATDPERVLELLSRLVRLICKAVMVLIVIVIAFNISIIIGIEILLFAIVIWIISYKFFPLIKKTQKKVKENTDTLIKNATENLTGIREIKSLGIKQNMHNIISTRIESVCDESMKIRTYENVFYSVYSVVYYILQFVILLTCGYLFVKGNIVYSIFIMIEMYIWRIDDVVSNLSEFGVNYNKVKVSLNRVDQIINNRLYDDEKYGNETLKDIQGVIEFKNVSFRYRDDEKLTLDKLSLRFEPNKKIAVVGRSGNGKSTIFNLLLRYFDATKGEVLIDGKDIRSLDEATLRNSISIIRQTPFLFNMSVIDNFKIVKPNVTLKEIKAVCKKAYIDEYIMSLPQKYNTIIGEGGINLSGGQKQRLAIARTLLLNTKIILFDEATSALDNESQEYIKKTIDNLVKDHTIIIVAHRLSTIIDADEIYLIDKGKLEASGKHQTLLKKSKIYKALYKNEE